MAAEPYAYATSAADVSAWLARVAGTRMVAVDTETSGWDPWTDRLRLVQVAAGGDHPVLVVDAEHVDAAALAPLMGDTSVLKVFHHASFDLRFLSVAGVRVRRIADTMLAQQLLNGGEKTVTGVGLAGLAEFRLGKTLDKSVRDTFGHDTALTDVHLQYAADDAAATLGVFD